MSVWGRIVSATGRMLGPWRPSESGSSAAFGFYAPTAAGVSVTEYTALNIAAVWACVRAIAEPLATLPVYLYRRTPAGRIALDGHPAARLVAHRPNPLMTPFVFRRTVQSHLVTWGNGYVEVVRDGADRPAQLWPVTPNRVRPEITDAGDLTYRIDGERRIAARDMVHLVGLSFDGVQGYSVIRMARESLGHAAATDQYGAAWFGNGGRPAAVLKNPKKISDKTRRDMREDWDALHSGPQNAGRIAILQEGTEYQAIGLPPEDSQFLMTRQFNVGEICRWFGVPPHRVFELSRATFSNIEWQGQEYLTYTLDPWNTVWEQELSYKLLTNAEQQDCYFETHTDRLLRTNLQARYAAYATGRQWGWLSANDVLRRENQPTIPNGDIYLVPANMVPADRAGQVQKATADNRRAMARQTVLDHRGEPHWGPENGR